jgi:hypothetical protein
LRLVVSYVFGTTAWNTQRDRGSDRLAARRGPACWPSEIAYEMHGEGCGRDAPDIVDRRPDS